MTGFRTYALIFTGACLIGAGFSFVLAFLTFAMEAQGFSGWQIGLSHSLGIGSIILVAHWVAEAIQRLGPVRSFTVWVGLLAGCLYLHALVAPALGLMLVARFGMGVANAALFATVESWLNAITPDRSRGRVLSLYCGILLLGFTAGSALLQVIPAQGLPPYIVASALFGGALPFIWLARSASVRLPKEEGFRFRDVFRLSPAIMIAAAVFGFSETIMLSLLPLFGLRLGLGEDESAALLTALLAGGVIAQPFIGWLADRVERYRMLAGLFSIALCGACFLPVFVGLGPLSQMLALALWGVGVLSIYTVIIALMGAQFREKSLAHGATAVITMYGLGSAFGPFSGGAVLDVYGVGGFRWLLAGVFVGALAVVFGAVLKQNPRTP